MNLARARQLAEGLAAEILPCCARVAVAGSVRRQKPKDLKDLELVVVPSWGTASRQEGLFETEERTNLLYRWAQEQQAAEEILWVKGFKPEGKYWQGEMRCGEKVDLFLTTPAQWGLILLIRTGSAEFSEAVVTHAKRIGKPSSSGWLWDGNGQKIETPEEADVFRVLGLEYVEPADRTGREALRVAREAAR